MTSHLRKLLPATMLIALASAKTSSNAKSLATVCTTSYVQSALPVDVISGVQIDDASLTVNAVYNASFTGSDFFPDAYAQSYCNVSFAYSHAGRGDSVLVWYWLPAPSNFKNRYLSTGGGGYSITSTDTSIPGGIIYGASAGTTDGGFGSFDTTVDEVVLLGNGSLNYESVYNFGYKAIHEMTVLGKQLTRNFFEMSADEKLYGYYQACSEGGREGWSQVQRFPEDYDGAIIGAPAMRYSHQQLQHLSASVVESYLNIYPKPCALDTLATEVLNFCDPLDGKTDGVVSRSDICKLKLNLDDFIGLNYSCAATPASTNPYNPQPAVPAQSGVITRDDIIIANHTLYGPQTISGEQVYVGWQPGAGFGDADTVYDNTTGNWTYSLQSFGVLFASKFILEQNVSTTIPGFDTWTPDTLRDMIYTGWQKFEDSLQTTWPDLTEFHEAGGKVIHFHGESDNSVPTASSVRYYESVRSVMFPDLSYAESVNALNSWYRLYLVDGAAHCSPDQTQCNGAFPQTNFPVMIDWVEKGIEPVTLNATVLNTCSADYGSNSQICSWPLRPIWEKNGTRKICEFPNQASLDTWFYDLNAFPMYVY
ncbi:hypothetical protein N7540_009572 [Penicillium herquei]|nr:hypothetical protein N7540_009572 [Penicillium herquei]